MTRRADTDPFAMPRSKSSEKAQVEARLRDSDERYLALFNAIEQGFCTLEVLFDEHGKPYDYRFLEVSPSFERQTGITDATGRRMRDIAPDQDEHWFEIYGRVALTGEPVRFENFSTPLGRWWSVYAFRIQDPALRRVGVLFYDITESKRAEEAIRASEERYRVFLELSNEGIWRFELDEPVRVDLPAESQVSEIFRNAWLAECNRAMARMYGYESANEIVGKRLTEFLDMADSRNLEYLEAFVREGFRLENMESHEADRDGRTLIFENSLVGHLEPGPGGVRRLVRAWGTQRDVTAQRKAEAALRESEERYRSLFESIDEGFCIVEMLFGEDGTPVDYRFVQTNPAFERLTGLDGAQDQLMLDLQPKIDPFWVETYGRVARTRQAERFVKASRGLRKWLSVYAFPTGDPAAQLVAVLITDITEQKLAEEELRAASTLKDEFLGLVSHELRTPLTVIRGSASLLNRYGDLPDSTRGEIIQDLIKESDRLNRVVENMLALGRLQAGEKPPTEPLLVSRAIERAVERFLEDQELNRIRIGPTPRGAIVLGVEGYVEQILHNFLSNAYKYSPADTTVTVLARQEGGFIRISVADRGRGLVKPAALFAPFYRDPESSWTTPGLGLGLAVSKRLVEAMGGQISGKARRGGGSVFSFTLPLQAAETQDD